MEHIILKLPEEELHLLNAKQHGLKAWAVPLAVALAGLGLVWRTGRGSSESAAYAQPLTLVTASAAAGTMEAPLWRLASSGRAQAVATYIPRAAQYSAPMAGQAPLNALRPLWSQGSAAIAAVVGLAAALLGWKMSHTRSSIAMFTTSGESLDADLNDETLPEDDEYPGGKEVVMEAEQKLEVPENTETAVGPSENFGFETNTKQILDIVARSLYHDKEVFIRELISNASDAIEKYRYLKLISDQDLVDPPEPKISLYADPKANTFTIQDTGVGMTKDELIHNLGTIANSGSKALIEKLQQSQKGDARDQLIGQFGVGFYSCFIVAKGVKVYTKACHKNATGYLWQSDGLGNYTITEAEGVAQGTKIIVELKDDEKEFSNDAKLTKIIKKYSNFIGSPIFLDGKRLNTIQALWRKSPKDVTEKEHEEFYKFIANAYDKPFYKLHYRVDAPVDVKAILYIPEYNMEQPGRNRLTSNVSLYCKQVLIKAKCEELLPEWLRFVSGVVDSEDLPLNVSREGTQDSRAFRKLSKLVTNRALKWLGDEADKDKAKYNKFFKEFGYFLKEGSCMDKDNQGALTKLLRFESSKLEGGELTSFDEYIERFVEGQKRIYFLHTASRETALVSPYYEQLRKKGVEVLFMYGQLDEYLMSNYPEYKEHKFTSIENSDLGLEDIKDLESEKAPEDDGAGEALNGRQCKRFSKFLMKALADRCSEAKASSRLTDSPAIIAAGFEQATMFRHLKQIASMQGKKGFEGPLGTQVLEFNPRHPIIKRLYWLTRSTDPESAERAKLMAEQLFDNALIASGLLEDPRLMLKRLNILLKDSLGDVEIGVEDETDPADNEPEPEPKPKAAKLDMATPIPEPELDMDWESMADEIVDDIGASTNERVNRMMEDTIAQNTAPGQDADVVDAEILEDSSKGSPAKGAEK